MRKIEEALDELFGVTKARQAAIQHFVEMGISPEEVTNLMDAEERRIVDAVNKGNGARKRKGGV